MEKQFLRLSSFGLIGDTHASILDCIKNIGIKIFLHLKVDIPASSDYIESFDCKKTQVNRYKVSFIKNSLKALVSSSKVAIRITDLGVMGIQFLIPIPELSKMAFVEFYVMMKYFSNLKLINFFLVLSR